MHFIDIKLDFRPAGATKSFYAKMYIISRNLVEYYCKCWILIAYATRYLFVDR